MRFVYSKKKSQHGKKGRIEVVVFKTVPEEVTVTADVVPTRDSDVLPSTPRASVYLLRGLRTFFQSRMNFLNPTKEVELGKRSLKIIVSQSGWKESGASVFSRSNQITICREKRLP